MKIKYFLRGVGIGIIITTILLGISYRSKMSDEAVISKAKKLGMVFEETSDDKNEESDVNNSPAPSDAGNENEQNASDAGNENEQNATDAVQSNDTTGDGDTESDDTNTQTDNVGQTDAAASDIPVSTPETNENQNMQETASTTDSADVTQTGESGSNAVTLVINRGDWSLKVSENLKELGIIDNPEEFDEFLVNERYADRIKVGSFEIEAGASYEEIARAITD